MKCTLPIWNEQQSFFLVSLNCLFGLGRKLSSQCFHSTSKSFISKDQIRKNWIPHDMSPLMHYNIYHWLLSSIDKTDWKTYYFSKSLMSVTFLRNELFYSSKGTVITLHCYKKILFQILFFWTHIMVSTKMLRMYFFFIYYIEKYFQQIQLCHHTNKCINTLK